MAKYTVIYDNGFTLVKKYIETNYLKESLKKIENNNVYIFYGWLENFEIITENTKTTKLVCIEIEQLEQLQKDSEFLQRLRNAGVNNWEGYEDCLGDD